MPLVVWPADVPQLRQAQAGLWPLSQVCGRGCRGEQERHRRNVASHPVEDRPLTCLYSPPVLQHYSLMLRLTKFSKHEPSCISLAFPPSCPPLRIATADAKWLIKRHLPPFCRCLLTSGQTRITPMSISHEILSPALHTLSQRCQSTRWGAVPRGHQAERWCRQGEGDGRPLGRQEDITGFSRRAGGHG